MSEILSTNVSKKKEKTSVAENVAILSIFDMKCALCKVAKLGRIFPLHVDYWLHVPNHRQFAANDKLNCNFCEEPRVSVFVLFFYILTDANENMPKANEVTVQF